MATTTDFYPPIRFFVRWTGWTLCLILLTLLAPVPATEADNRTPTVGAPGSISDLILPGTELTNKPLREGAPMVVRVVQALPHGDRFRYQIQFQGLEAGDFDLAEWLERKDGSSTEDLPEIKVQIKSLLPPGQIKPNDLQPGLLPRIGGYRAVAIGAAVVWLLGLVALIAWRRGKPQVEDQSIAPATLADLLHSRISAALAGDLPKTQYAELERMLYAMWRTRLQLESIPAADAIRKIKADPSSGPLMVQLERWLHQPDATKSNPDWGQLLEPYRNIPAEALENPQAHGESL